MTWATEIAKPNTSVFFYVQFGGINKYFTTFDPTTRPSSNSWTTSGWTWHEVLDRNNLSETSSKINRRTGITTSGTFSFQLLENIAEDLVDTFSFQKTGVNSTNVTAEHDLSDTTITVEDTTGFASSGDAYIGNETFTYSGTTSTTFTGVTRGVYNSDKNTYKLEEIEEPGGTQRGAEVTDGVRTWRNRKVYVYMNILDADGNPVDNDIALTHEKLVFKGFISDMEIVDGGKTWRFTAKDPLSLLQRSINKNPVTRTVKTSVHYFTRTPAARVTWMNTNWSRWDKITIYNNDGAQGETFSLPHQQTVNISGLTEPFAGNKTLIVDQVLAPIREMTAGVDYQSSNITWKERNGYLEFRNDNGAFTIAVWDTIRRESNDTVRSCFGFSNGQMIIDRESVNIETFTSTGIKGVNSAMEETVVGDVPALLTWGAGGESAIPIDGDAFVVTSSDATKFVKIQDEIIRIQDASTQNTHNINLIDKTDESDYGRGLYGTKEEPHTAEPGGVLLATQVPIFDDENVFDILLQSMLSFDGDGGNDATWDVLPDGMGAKIPSEYVDVASFRDLAGDLEEFARRRYVFEKPTSIMSVIQEESKTLGFYVTLDENFKIAVKQLGITKSDSSVESIDQTSIIPDTARLDLNLKTLVNQLEISANNKVGNDEFKDRVTVENVDSQNRYQEVAKIKINNKGLKLREDDAGAKEFLRRMTSRFLLQFSDPYPFIEVECDRTKFPINIGDLVKFSHNTLPHPRDADFGYTDEWCIVVGMRRNYNTMKTMFTLTMDDFKLFKKGLLCPNMETNSAYSGMNFTVVANSFTDSSGSKKDSGWFSVGDQIRCYDPSASAFRSSGTVDAEITAISADGLTITTDAAITGLASGDIIFFTEYDNANTTAGQKLHVYFGDDSSENIGTANDDPYLYI